MEQTHLSPNGAGGGFDFEALVHPWRVFAHPSEVLARPTLSPEEKRAILASWASDAYAVESAPSLRCPPGSGAPVRLDDILEALRTLDGAKPEVRPDPGRRSWFDVLRPARAVRWAPPRKPVPRAGSVH